MIMLYKNEKPKVHSPDRDIDFYYIIAGVLQRDILVPYLFINCLDYVLQASLDLMK